MTETPKSMRPVAAEEALLGGLMLDPAAWARVRAEVGSQDFSVDSHRKIFAAIERLKADGIDADAVTVADALEQQGVHDARCGLAALGRMVRDTPTAENIESYAATVRGRSATRRLLLTLDALKASAIDPGDRSVSDLIADTLTALSSIQAQARTGKGLVPVSQLVADLSDDLDRRSEGPTGLRVGLADFDGLTNGLEPGDLVVIGARPGMGKTALLVSMAATVSQSTGTAIFSAEMPSMQLMRRILALQSLIPQGLLRRTDQMDENQWARIFPAMSAIAGRKLWIDDTGAPSLAHIRAETLALKAKGPLGLVLVDYCQLVRAPGANRYEQLRDVAYGLKALAKELAVPVIVLAQLNRQVEAREQKRPSVADLRDSGAIEEAADTVALLYSEGFYDPSFPMPYVLESAIEKNRNGERGGCLWKFDAAFSRVTLLDAGSTAQYRRLLQKSQIRETVDL